MTRTLTLLALGVTLTACGPQDPQPGGTLGPGEDHADPCAGAACSGHGTCLVVEGVVRCACNEGYVEAPGPACRPATSPCAGQDCGEHGMCDVQGGEATCICAFGYHAEGLRCLPDQPCTGVDCSGHGVCVSPGDTPTCQCQPGFRPAGADCVAVSPCDDVTCNGNGTCRVTPQGHPACQCSPGFHPVGLSCVNDADPCAGQGCSGRGTCRAVAPSVAVCVCAAGHTASPADPLNCVPTSRLCAGGPIAMDVDEDGTVDSWFEPTPDECLMFELVNHTRASHDAESTEECHHPLAYSVEWSAHGRNHSKRMRDQGGLFHADYPGGQNCAYGCDMACLLDLYMTGPNEGHCPVLSHHCNIMRCGFSFLGVGNWEGAWNTQNFY